MATYTRPDVYIEEILTPDNAPQGVSTSIAGFVGATERGPGNKAIFISSFDDFKRVFGGAVSGEPLFYTVRSFFENGGSACYIVRLLSKAQLDASIAPANNTIQNNNATPADFLKFSAGYRGLPSYGVSGKDLSVKVSLSDTSSISALSLDAAQNDTEIKVDALNGIRKGDVLKIVDGSNPALTEYVVVSSLESEIVNPGAVVTHKIGIVGKVSQALTAAGSAISVLSYKIEVLKDDVVVETFSDVSTNTESDFYIETIINDEELGSRFIKVEDLVASATINADREILAADLNEQDLDTNGEPELSGFDLVDDLIGDETNQTGLYALNPKDAVNILVVPPSLDTAAGIFPTADVPKLHLAMLSFCEKRLDMFAVLDAPAGQTMSASGVGSIGQYRTGLLGVDNYWGALYYPHISIPKSLGSRTTVKIPPSGAIAGLYSRVDQLGAPNGGVASSPAGYGEFGLLRGVSELEYEISESLHGELNVLGVNCIRIVERASGNLPGALVLGARTLSSIDDFRYINARRMLTFIEKTVKRIGKPYLFRNNSPRLWGELTSEITSFLREQLQEGSLAGASEEESFFVKIDASTNTADNIQKGILVGEIGVALLRPAEFVVFRFSQIQTGSQE
jgi:phage tail sheath protein FI